MILLTVLCPEGHETQYSKMHINMKTGKITYACHQCKKNHEAYLLVEDKEVVTNAEKSRNLDTKEPLGGSGGANIS